MSNPQNNFINTIRDPNQIAKMYKHVLFSVAKGEEFTFMMPNGPEFKAKVIDAIHAELKPEWN